MSKVENKNIKTAVKELNEVLNLRDNMVRVLLEIDGFDYGERVEDLENYMTKFMGLNKLEQVYLIKELIDGGFIVKGDYETYNCSDMEEKDKIKDKNIKTYLLTKKCFYFRTINCEIRDNVYKGDIVIEKVLKGNLDIKTFRMFVLLVLSNMYGIKNIKSKYCCFNTDKETLRNIYNYHYGSDDIIEINNKEYHCVNMITTTEVCDIIKILRDDIECVGYSKKWIDNNKNNCDFSDEELTYDENDYSIDVYECKLLWDYDYCFYNYEDWLDDDDGYYVDFNDKRVWESNYR